MAINLRDDLRDGKKPQMPWLKRQFHFAAVLGVPFLVAWAWTEWTTPFAVAATAVGGLEWFGHLVILGKDSR